MPNASLPRLARPLPNSRVNVRWLLLASLASGALAGCHETYRREQVIRPSQPGNLDASSPLDAGATPSSDARSDADTPAPVDAGQTPTEDAALPPSDAAITPDAAPTLDGSLPDAGGDAALPPPLADGVPPVNASVATQAAVLDLFGPLDNHFWLLATEGQVSVLNNSLNSNGGNCFDCPYSPGGTSKPVKIEHAVVTTGSQPPLTADYGSVGVRLDSDPLGGTGRTWTETTLPNFELYFDETPHESLAGQPQVSLHNALMGSIFREKLAQGLFSALGYPVQRVNFAWVSSSVWEPDVNVPYVLTEPYGREFCEREEDALHGGCTNVWQGTTASLDAPGKCLLDECDATRLDDLNAAASEAAGLPGFKQALAEWIDWPAFHQFQCAVWMLDATATPIRGSGQVLVERADGKFQFLPNNLEVSMGAGSNWDNGPKRGGGSISPLGGYHPVAAGCQTDAECWADTLATCADMLDALEAADPAAQVEALYNTLDDAGMLRPGDDDRRDALVEWTTDRVATLREALPNYENNPFYMPCTDGRILCGTYCELPQYCYLCNPGRPYYYGIDYAPVAMDGRAAPGGEADVALPVPNPVPVPVPVPPAGDAGVPPECYVK